MLRAAPSAVSEEERLHALHAYRILDTPAEEAFDALVQLASEICGTPIALLTLVDRDRQWFKSAVGVALHETPRSVSFCSHAIQQDDLFVVRDATKDARFQDNPYVLADPNVRFYTGAPLRTPEGYKLGTLCVIDRVPRELTPLQRRTLVTLGHQVEALLELRRTSRELLRHEARARAHAEHERDHAVGERDRFFELSVDPMCVAGVDGYFKKVNSAFARTLGYSAEELLSQPYVDLVHPDDVGRTRDEAASLATGGRPAVRFENRYRGKDGVYRWISWTTVVVQEEGLIYAIARDVSEKKLLEAQLLHAQKMEAVGQLAGGIAHDFNNLLSVIMGFGQMIESDLPEGSPVRDDIQQILKASERAAHLTRQLLVFSRKRSAEPPRRVQLRDLVADMGKMLQRVVGEEVDMATRADPALGTVRADPSHLEQILVNLVVNARDAMPRGGKLTVELTNVVLDGDYAKAHAEVRPGEYVMLAVSDTGCGMDAATQSRIFEPFFTTKEVGKGTGLGLATVFAIVKDAGGHVWVYSEVGVGTTFKVYLPRADDGEVELLPSTPEVADSLRGDEVILLVEDEPMVREFAERALTRLGYSVISAGSGSEAAERAREVALHTNGRGSRLDLLITDVVLPGVRGPELAASLREQYPWLQVLLISGYTHESLERRDMVDEDVHFIEKPISSERLARAVAKVLQPVRSAAGSVPARDQRGSTIPTS